MCFKQLTTVSASFGFCQLTLNVEELLRSLAKQWGGMLCLSLVLLRVFSFASAVSGADLGCGRGGEFCSFVL